MTINQSAIHSDIAIPPGEYLEEIIEELGMTKEELARRMDRPAPKLSRIFKGEKAITPDTAIQFEKVLGVPAHIWIGLEAEYRLIIARDQEEKGRRKLMDEGHLIARYRYNDLVKIGQLPKYNQTIEKVAALQRFFGVTSLNTIPELSRYRAAFRGKSHENRTRSPHALSAWLRLGEKRANRMACSPFKKKDLRRLLPELRRMSRQHPETFIEDLRYKMAETGIAWMIVPVLPKINAYGAAFWIRRDKAVLMMTLQSEWADEFWHRLFHGIGHFLLHKPQMIFIEDENPITEHPVFEAEADRFAADTLIPPKEYAQFLQEGDFCPDAILRFADRIEIDAGIVVERLQQDKWIEPSEKDHLRARYDWRSFPERDVMGPSFSSASPQNQPLRITPLP